MMQGIDLTIVESDLMKANGFDWTMVKALLSRCRIIYVGYTVIETFIPMIFKQINIGKETIFVMRLIDGELPMEYREQLNLLEHFVQLYKTQLKLEKVVSPNGQQLRVHIMRKDLEIPKNVGNDVGKIIVE